MTDEEMRDLLAICNEEEEAAKQQQQQQQQPDLQQQLSDEDPDQPIDSTSEVHSDVVDSDGMMVNMEPSLDTTSYLQQMAEAMQCTATIPEQPDPGSGPELPASRENVEVYYTMYGQEWRDCILKEINATLILSKMMFARRPSYSKVHALKEDIRRSHSLRRKEDSVPCFLMSLNRLGVRLNVCNDLDVHILSTEVKEGHCMLIYGEIRKAFLQRDIKGKGKEGLVIVKNRKLYGKMLIPKIGAYWAPKEIKQGFFNRIVFAYRFNPIV